MTKEVKEPSMAYGKVYTYADYLTWTIKERIELIKGRVFKMSPAPAVKHQKVSRELSLQLGTFFKHTNCQMFTAPFDVRLTDKRKKSKKDEDITTVFQPDLCVICDENKLDERGCIGAPDLIIEILSPSNSSKEMKNKYELYEENGVKEYWVVDYTHQTILIYILENNTYKSLKPYTSEDVIQSYLFSKLTFDVKEIFED
ncbi:MAG: Uma2 family endonuclease [Chitinophagales bacterium]|nr:Uma2 family endonuclease [Chitinophagales bacterium]